MRERSLLDRSPASMRRVWSFSDHLGRIVGPPSGRSESMRRTWSLSDQSGRIVGPPADNPESMRRTWSFSDHSRGAAS